MAPRNEENAGDDAAPGDATWIHTFYDTEDWDSPGGDFVASPSASRIARPKRAGLLLATAMR